jgi:hypothetical protein
MEYIRSDKWENPMGLAIVGMMECMWRFIMPVSTVLETQTERTGEHIFTDLMLKDIDDSPETVMSDILDLGEMARGTDKAFEEGKKIDASRAVRIVERIPSWHEADIIFMENGNPKYHYQKVAVLAMHAWIPTMSQWLQDDPINSIDQWPEVITQYGDSDDNYSTERGLTITKGSHSDRRSFTPFLGGFGDLRNGEGQVSSNKLGRIFRWILAEKNIGTTTWLELAAAYVERSKGDIDQIKRTSHVTFSFATEVLTWGAFEAGMDIIGVEIEHGLTEEHILAGHSRFELNKLVWVQNA